MQKKMLMLTAGLILVFLLSGAILAVNTARWELNTKEVLAKGELENLVLDYDGKILPGKASIKIAVQETSIWSSVLDRKGTAYFGSGSGKIYKLAEQRLEEVYATGELLVTSLAVSEDNEIFAGTIPHGKIFKINTKGEGALFATVPAEYIWSLAFDKKNPWLYAATGPGGKLFKINPAGQVELFYESKRENILSLAVNGDGGLYFGTANPGVLYKISSQGKPEVLHNFGEAEVKSIFYHSGIISLAVNSSPKVPPQEFLGALSAAVSQPQKESGPVPTGQPPQPAPAEKGSPAPPAPEPPKPVVQSYLYQFIESSKQLREITVFNNCYLTELKLNQQTGEIFAGTDNTGKIFQVRPDGKSAVPFDFETKQVLTFLLDKEGNPRFIGTGGQGNVYLVNHAQALTATYVSDILDAKFQARWGALEWQGNTSLAFQTRSGNTEKPDETWSDWSAELKSASKITSPSGRYLQFKINWPAAGPAEGPAQPAFIRKISVAYLINNQKPKLTDLTIAEQPSETAPAPATESTKPPPPPKNLKKITWQAVDPDNDPLVFNIFYKEENNENWLRLNTMEPVAGNEYLWNTSAAADGKYFIKVEVSDEKSNPAERANLDEKISQPVIVDNTRPMLKDISINKKLEFSGTVEDNFNYIERIEYSLDGGDWRLVYPLDDIFDEKTEQFSFAPANITPGGHTVVIRAWDANGNLGVVQNEFKVK